jgi:aminoglycoside phosphotransferase family enzyme
LNPLWKYTSRMSIFTKTENGHTNFIRTSIIKFHQNQPIGPRIEICGYASSLWRSVLQNWAQIYTNCGPLFATNSIKAYQTLVHFTS